jgi:transcriptional regulator with XRE-family HTH domain
METDMNTSIGPIMKAARKFKKLNQSEVAKAIGCSQSALSKMEHNLLVPSAPQWFLFSRFTSIPPETLESGFIDRHSTVKFNSDEVSLGFKIPRKYRNFRAEKVRELYPFMLYLKKHFPDELQSFIVDSEIDIEFFLDFDNLINFQLYRDMIERFIKLGRAAPHDICQMAFDGHDDTFWDGHETDWSNLKGPEELLILFSKKQIYFQTDFQVTLEHRHGRCLLDYKPEYHLKNIEDNDGRITTFLNEYRKCMLENMIKRFLNLTVKIEILEDVKEPLSGKLAL